MTFHYIIKQLFLFNLSKQKQVREKKIPQFLSKYHKLILLLNNHLYNFYRTGVKIKPKICLFNYLVFARNCAKILFSAFALTLWLCTWRYVLYGNLVNMLYDNYNILKVLFSMREKSMIQQSTYVEAPFIVFCDSHSTERRKLQWTCRPFKKR